jgi:patatin-like phospholipase/acyl hydrolase
MNNLAHLTQAQSKQDAGTNPSNPYNILSIEGGGIRGIIPSIVVDHMEFYAYKYAVEKKYIVKDGEKDINPQNRIQIKDLFHMVSSTSSSSILAGFLVRPVEKATNTSFYARDVTKFFKENSESFF